MVGFNHLHGGVGFYGHFFFIFFSVAFLIERSLFYICTRLTQVFFFFLKHLLSMILFCCCVIVLGSYVCGIFCSASGTDSFILPHSLPSSLSLPIFSFLFVFLMSKNATFQISQIEFNLKIVYLFFFLKHKKKKKNFD